MQIRKFAGQILTALLCFSTTAALARPELDKPQFIYQQAWQQLKNKFYDANLNGQDWQSWQHRYDGKLKTDKQAYKAITEMVKSLNDPYTRLLEPESLADEERLIGSKLVGIGVLLEQLADKSGIVIQEVLDGGPACSGGLKKGDKLIAVNGSLVDGQKPELATRLLPGKEGTKVSLRLEREGKTSNVDLVRRQFTVEPVSAKIMPGNIGYIRVASFISEDTSLSFRKALSSLRSTDGLIVDLRNNPGGLLENALDMADFLLERSGTIVGIVDRQKHVDQQLSSGRAITNQPVAVLVDKGSASASEIFAAAVKENGRAVIVGNKTFGKGIMQELVPLPGGAGLHVTVASLITPQGNQLHHAGVTPQVQVPEGKDGLNVALELMKQKIAGTTGKARLVYSYI